MPVCEFCPTVKGEVTCQQFSLLAAMMKTSGLRLEEIKELVCGPDATNDLRANDCPGFNSLITFGASSRYARLDPNRFPDL
jgi:hypothetical protein